MTELLTVKPESFGRTVGATFIAYGKIFTAIFLLDLACAFTFLFGTLVYLYRPFVGLAIFVLMMLLATFLTIWAVHRANTVLFGVPNSKRDSYEAGKSQFIYALAAIGIWLVLTVVIWFICLGIYHFLALINVPVIAIIIGVLFYLYISVFFFLTVPSIVVDKLTPMAGYRASMCLVKGHWWRAFGVLILPFLILFILAAIATSIIGSHNMVALSIYYLLQFIVLYPLFVATVLVLLHDLKARADTTCT